MWNNNRIWKIALIVVILMVSFTVVAATALQIKRNQVAGVNNPPGQLIDVGNYRLHLFCSGEGKPTVLLEADINEFSLNWFDIQTRLAKTTKVCSYDRAGLGWSDASSLPRTMHNIVKELNILLTNARLQPPYIFVGHSYGGYIAMHYAQAYPSQLAAMVLIDSAHPRQFARLPSYFSNERTEKLLDEFQQLQYLNKAGVLALEPEYIPDHGMKEPALTEYRTILSTTDHFAGALQETKALLDTFRNSSSEIDTEPRKLTIPVRVISRGKSDGMTSEEFATWRELQTELAKMSRNGSLYVARKSGHYVHMDQPQFVEDLISNMVAKF